MTGLHIPDAVRIIGPRPALGVVPGVTQRVKEFLVSGWGDIERFARGQLDARGDRMDVWSTVVVTVQHGACRVLVGSETRECRVFPLFYNGIYLVRSGVVVRRPGDHP